MKPKKICLTCGPVSNVGKTTIGKHLKGYLERMGKSSVLVGLESPDQRKDGEDELVVPTVEAIRDLFSRMSILGEKETMIVDVGSEFYGEFMASKRAFGKSFDAEFDLFIVPMTPMIKPENVKTAIERLIADGADPRKIVVVVNRVVPGKEDQALAFAREAIGELAGRGVQVSDEVIYEMTFFGRIRGKGVSYSRLCDAPAVRQQMKAALAASNRDEAVRLADVLIDGSEARMATGCFVRMLEPIFY